MRFLVVLLAFFAHAAAAQEISPLLVGGIEAFQAGIRYPDMEMRARIEGRVLVRFVVQPTGATSDVAVVDGVSPGLDSAAVAALRAARFVPGTVDGVPVPVRQTLPVSFHIEGPLPAGEIETGTPDTAPVPVGGWPAVHQNIVYPEDEGERGVQGIVVVRYVVDTRGVPQDVEVAHSVSPGLDGSVVAAIWSARFTPGLLDGRPVRVRRWMRFRFDLGDGEPYPYTAQGDLSVSSRWDASFAARADSGRVVDGNGRLRWAGLRGLYERVATLVEDSVVTESVWTLRASADFDSVATELTTDFPGVAPRADGFYHASDLVAEGVGSASDLRLDPARRQVQNRRPRCDAGCASPFPMLIGGIAGVAQRARDSVAVPVRAPRGRIVCSMEIDGDGRVFDVRVASNTVGGRAGEALGHAARDAFAAARFVVDPLRDGPETDPVTLAVEFDGTD